MKREDVKFITVIMGEKGVGKTTLACSAPKPLLFDLEKGAYRSPAADDVNVISIDSWEELEHYINDGDLLADYDTLIFDAVADLVSLKKSQLLAQSKKGTLTLHDWGVVKERVGEFHRKLKKLKKHIVYLAHLAQVNKTNPNGEVVESKLVLDCDGAFKSIVINDGSLVGMVRNENGVRVFDCAGCYKYEFPHGNSMGETEPFVVPPVSVYCAGNFLANLFKKQYEYWRNAEEAREKKREVALKIQEMINNVEDVECLNEAYVNIRPLIGDDFYLKSWVKETIKMFQVRLNCYFDKSSNTFKENAEWKR